MRGSFGEKIRLVRDLIAYSIREQTSIVPITLLGLFSSMIELAVVISIIPLGIISGGHQLSPTSFWHRFPTMLGLAADARFYVFLFLSLMLLRMATFMTTQVLNSYVMQSLMAHFSTRALDSFVRHLPFRDILQHQIGHFVTLAGDEASRGAQIVVGVMKLVPVAFLFMLYIGLLLYQSPLSGLALLTVLLVIVLSLRNAFRQSLALGQRQQEQSRIAGTHFIETLSGLRTVRGFTAEVFVTSHYETLMQNYARTLFLNDALSQLTQFPAMVIIALVLVAVSVYGDSGWLILHMPIILAAIMMFMRLLPIANQGLEAGLKLTANLKAGSNVADMLNAVRTSNRQQKLEEFPAEERITEIAFRNVTFRYTKDTPFILSRFDCHFRAGHSYAITGPSGVGKSSLVDLLLKFFDPIEGCISVNGRDIASLTSASLRQHVVLAEQTTRIFHGTVVENVQFGHTQANEQAYDALKSVGLQDFLATLPEGAETVLSFQGSNFSGGQRQRVGLARALTRTADVLILDESTNALDHLTRERVLDALMREYKDRILIFVTHDPYVMERVSDIIELRPQGDFAATSAPRETVISASQLRSRATGVGIAASEIGT